MKNKAHELIGWLADAVSDVASGELYPSKNYNEIEMRAEDLYNDVGTCRDLLGNRIFDAVGEIYGTKEWKTKALELCEHLSEIGHMSVKIAMDGFITDHKLKG